MGAAGMSQTCMSTCVGSNDGTEYQYPAGTSATVQAYPGAVPFGGLPDQVSAVIGPCFSNSNGHWRRNEPGVADDSNPYLDFRFTGDEVQPSKFQEVSEVTQWRQETNKYDMFNGPVGGGAENQNEGSIQSSYKVERDTLGAGAYGICHKAFFKKTNEARAVKTIFKTKAEAISWAREEVRIMKLLNHPNIIKLYETYEEREAFHIIMELCAGEGLVDKLRDGGYFTEVQAMVLMHQILRAVEYVHSMGICHRDIKPENFLLLTLLPIERNTLKMIDFGMSCFIKPGETLKQRVGTPYFTAPEVLKGRYTECCDIWSCGVMLFLFLCGQMPFNGTRKEDVLKAVEHGNFQFTANAWRKISDDAKNLTDRKSVV